MCCGLIRKQDAVAIPGVTSSHLEGWGPGCTTVRIPPCIDVDCYQGWKDGDHVEPTFVSIVPSLDYYT